MHMRHEADNSIKVQVTLDLVAAREHLASDLPDRVRSGHTGCNNWWNGKTDRELLTKYIMSYAIVDDAAQETAIVELEYEQSELGQKLEQAGVLGPTRRYAGAADPFELPSGLNDLLTHRFYENWDDSKAYQRYIRAFTQIQEVQQILDEFLEAPTKLCTHISQHYFGSSTKQHMKQVKALLHRLSMDGTIKVWRQENAVSSAKQDHQFVLEYSRLMPLVTDEVQTLPSARQGMRIIEEHNKATEATSKRPKLQWKSYVLQSIEIQAQTRKRQVLTNHNLGVGSLEHDGLKQRRSDAGPNQAQLQQELGDAATRGAAEAVNRLWHNNSNNTPTVLIPVEPKSEPPVDPCTAGCRNNSFAYCSQLEPPLFVQFWPDTEAQCKNSHRWYLALLNRFFVIPTKGMKSTVIQLEYYPWTDQISSWEITTPEKLKQTFPGFVIKVAEGQSEPLFSWWFKQDNRRTHRALGFYPEPNSCPRGDLNTFGGLPFDYLPRESIDMDLVQPVLDHYRFILAAGGVAHYEYQLNWTAASLQWRRKLGVAWIVYGQMGGGKNVIVGDEGLFAAIWGQYFYKSNDLDQFINSRFNSDSVGKLMACGDEVTPYNKSHRGADKLKDIITAPFQRLERKGIDPTDMQDHRNFVFTTNNPDGFRFDSGDRRQYMVEIADTYSKAAVGRGDKTDEQVLRYFSHVLGARYGLGEPARKANKKEIEVVARHFYWWLMDRDVSHFNPSKFPTSAIRENQIAENADNINEFFLAWEEGLLPGPHADQDGAYPCENRDWATDCTKVWRVKQVKQLYDQYLKDFNLPPDSRSGKHMSNQLERYNGWIRPQPTEKRHPLGRPWLLGGHPDFNGGPGACKGVGESARAHAEGGYL